jgi:hypothetical protein
MLVRVWAIELPLPLLAPVILGAVTVQANAVPVTFDVKLIAVEVPLQMVCDVGDADTTGIGLTVTTTLIGVPVQEFAVGVIVYVAVPVVVPVVVNV